MTLRTTGLLAAAAVFAIAGFSGGEASAQDLGHLSGDVAAGYTHFDTKGSPTNEWTASGSAVFTIANPGPDIQLNFDNAGLKVATQSADHWSYGADFFWRDYAGDFGVNITQSTVSTGKSIDYLSGGFFGEFFPLSDLTLRAKGGRLQGNFDGWYGDTGLVFYPVRDIALKITGDYARLINNGPQLTDGSLEFEYLPVRDVPISLTFGYTYSKYQHLTGGLNENLQVFSVSLKAYFGSGGHNESLVDYQRSGTTDWDGTPPGIVGIGF